MDELRETTINFSLEADNWTTTLWCSAESQSYTATNQKAVETILYLINEEIDLITHRKCAHLLQEKSQSSHCTFWLVSRDLSLQTWNFSCKKVLWLLLVRNWPTLLVRTEFICRLDSLLNDSGKHFFGISPCLFIRLTIMSHCPPSHIGSCNTFRLQHTLFMQTFVCSQQTPKILLIRLKAVQWVSFTLNAQHDNTV